MAAKEGVGAEPDPEILGSGGHTQFWTSVPCCGEGASGLQCPAVERGLLLRMPWRACIAPPAASVQGAGQEARWPTIGVVECAGRSHQVPQAAREKGGHVMGVYP